MFVPLLVLAELSWVLRGAWTRERVLEATRRGGHGGFADQLIALVGFAHGAEEVISFDQSFGKAPKVRRLRPTPWPG